MKKYLLFIWILLINTCLYSLNVNCMDFVLLKNKNNFIKSVKENEDLILGLKSYPPSFYFSANSNKNLYPHIFKHNSLFLASGDILNEDFETVSGWTYTNGATGNKWVVGTAVKNGGSKSLYISKDDGVTYEYDTKLATVVHAYKDFTIPATADEVSISFDWKCLGEGTNPKQHYFNAWLVPDTFVPAMGTKITELKDQRILLGSFNNNDNTFRSEVVGIDSNSFKGKKLKIVFEWINDTKGGWQPPAAIDNLNISTVKCTKPSNVIFENIKANSVLMKWDASKVKPDSYEVYYSKDSIPPTNTIVPTKKDIKTTSSVLDKLDPNTVYYVWIRSVCGKDKGVWSKEYQFKTACGDFNIPFKEGFNTDSKTIDCWTIVDENKDNDIWKIATYGAFEGDQAMTFNKYDSSNTIENDDWLISPTFKMNGTYRLKYHYKAYVVGNNEFEVLLSKDGKEIKDFKKVLVAKKTYKNDEYIEKTVILDKVIGDINIAWHSKVKGTSTVYIDNIIIEEVKNCPEPLELDVKDIKTEQATIFWQDDLGGKKWEYFVQEEGTGVPIYTDTGTITTKKEVVVNKDENGNNIKPNTEYEYYVRVVCEDGKFSIWSGPKKFRTLCGVFSVPFWEGFNKDSKSIICWTVVNADKDGSKWSQNSINPYEGNHSMVFDSSNFFYEGNDDWLISPTLKINGTYRLRYHYMVYDIDDKKTSGFEVLLSKDGKEIKDFKKTLVAKKNYDNIKKYFEEKVILYKLSDDINIAWHVKGKVPASVYIDNVIIEEVEGCPEPFDLDAKDFMPNKANISWSNEFGAKKWEYFVQSVGKGNPIKSGTITSKNENDITKENITGSILLPNTEYEFYVRTVCEDGKNSLWSGPFVFRTKCDTYNIPFKENFEDSSKTIPCWEIIDGNSDDAIWGISKYEGYAGTQSMVFGRTRDSITTKNDDWLISPGFKMNGTYRVKYYYKVSNTYFDNYLRSIDVTSNEFEVLFSKDGEDPKDFKNTLVAKKTYNNEDYIEKVAMLYNVAGDINIAWHANGKETSLIYIDDILIEKVENCGEPLDLEVKDVLSNKVTISWVDGSGLKSWEYFVQPSGKGEPTFKGTITSNKENVITKDNETGGNLLPNTEYEFYVRTVCGDGTNSIWSGPVVFRTECNKFYDIPFWEGFNTDSESVYCWTALDGDGDKTTWENAENYIDPFVGAVIFSYEGNKGMVHYKRDYSNVYKSDDWLISPTVKATGGMYRIKYHYKIGNFDNNEFEILMSKKGIDTKSFTDTILKKQTYNNRKYQEKVIFLDNLKGNVNFAWHITSTGSSDVSLDNVFIEKVKGCPEPYYVNITGQTDNSVSIEWEQYGSGDKWEVIAVPYGEKIPDEKDLKPIVVTKDPKATITGLDSGKVYTFYVRVICKDGSPSYWSTGELSTTDVKANDDCSGAYNIPVNKLGDGCVVYTMGTLKGSTLSKNPKGKCYDFESGIKSDVWFEFTPISETHILNISDIISLSNIKKSVYDPDKTLFSVALYGGDCSVSDSPIDCYNVEKTITSSFLKELRGLEVGKKYYLKIHSKIENADFSFKICMSSPTLYVSPSGEDYTVEELVKDVLVESNCDLVSNIKYRAGEKSKINTLGYFNKKNSSFPFDKGIILATHAVKYSAGPFIDFGVVTGGFGDVKKEKVPVWIGDPDLNKVIDQIGGEGFGTEKYVSVLEFDFIPIKDSIKFEYIFASESYRSWCGHVCKDGGALFAAWLIDVETGEGQNLALVPGTKLPIALSTIRDSYKTGAKCKSQNPQFFDQYYVGNLKVDPLTVPINYAGVTVPMTSEKVAVKPGKNYHIKLAIADYCPNDIHTSAVFFNGASFDLGRLDLGTDMLVATNTALCDGRKKTLYSGLDKNQATIKWYKDGVLIPGENDSKLTVSELGDYEVVGKYNFLKCEIKGSIRIEIFPKIEDLISDSNDISYCVNSLTGKNVVDITTNEQIVLKNLKAVNYKFFYYLTKEDSEKNQNAIKKPKEFKISKDGKSKNIYVRIVNTITTCVGFQEFSLVPQRIEMPVSPGDQQVCASYTFKELPQGQHYFTEKGAKGKEYKAGDVIDKQGDYKIYICSIAGDCYEEVSFNLEILPAVKAKVFKDEILKCENYVLQDLPAGNRYFTEPEGQGEELFAGDVIRFDKTVYVYAKSAQGPNYCIDQSSFTITFEDCDIPKGISPNGDGLNDVLDLEVHGVTSIVIYNRYGMEVYSHGEGYTNQWHGQNHSGNQLPDGTYYYAIEARGKTKTGWIQINR